MSLLALSFLMTAAAAPADEADILVIGQRLAGVTAAITRDDRGKLQCSISRSTGVAHLDEALCRTASDCVRKGARAIEAIKACVTARKPALLDEVRARLKGGRA